MKYQSSHKKKYKDAFDSLKKKANQMTTTESEPKTSRHAMKRRSNDKTDIQRSVEATRAHTRNIEKMRIKVIHKKRGNVEEVGNYRPIYTLPALYNHIQQTLQQTRPSATRRPRRIWTFLPNAVPSCNIQTTGTEMPGVENQKDVSRQWTS